MIAGRYRNPEEKRRFVLDLFDRAAPFYDRVGSIGFLGTGHAYRRRALKKAGLVPGMSVLDVACGTGAVTRAILEILNGSGKAIGVDPSAGMLSEAKNRHPAEFREGHAEALPVGRAEFDFVSMGYALRHVEDLVAAFKEFHRVLKPGGRLLILEISRPQTRLSMALARFYFRDYVPALTRLATRSRDAHQMMVYYWETIEACVPPDDILSAMKEAGFQDVNRRVELGIFSEYRATKSR